MQYDDCIQNIKESIKKPPSMRLHIINWHWKSGKKAEKVETGEASEPFLFNNWADFSPPAECLHYVDVNHITCVFNLYKIIMS